MKLVIINGFCLLIALKAFAVPRGNSSASALWSECNLEKNGLFKLEKGCKNLQICYKSELAGKFFATGGTSKFGGRFRFGKRVNKMPLSDCAGVVARKGWHALNVSKNSDRNFTIQSSLGLDGQFGAVLDTNGKEFTEAINISKDFGPIETDFVKALHLGAFMKDFYGMAFRIFALDLLASRNGQNGTGLCKKKCMNCEPATNTTTTTPTTTTVLRPPHFCKQAVETPDKQKTFGQKCPNGEQFCYLFNCTSATMPNNTVLEWGCVAEQSLEICEEKLSEYGFALDKDSCLCSVGIENTNVQLKRMRLSRWPRILFIPVVHTSFSFASRSSISQFIMGVIVVLLPIVCGWVDFPQLRDVR